MRTAAVMLACALTLTAQGTNPKTKSSDYPVHAVLSDAEVGADFMVRLISYERASFITNNYLVVEVALFPVHGRTITINASHFTLRVNGKSDKLMTQTPGIVAASIKYSDWSLPQTQATAGIGDTDVILGAPTAGRFPGDNRAPRQPMPPVPRAPEDENKPDMKPLDPTEVITRSALPEGSRKTSASGYLFFPWRGNPSKLKSVELIISGESAEPVVLRLR